MMDRLHVPVVRLLRQVGRDIIMPRYRNLSDEHIVEKAADDLVTIADHESEARLAEGLHDLLPDAGIIGEEACAARPELLDRAGIGLNWIIDPIDGTGNFAAGRPPFGILLALVQDGETQAGWLYDPLGGRVCHAARGGGAFIDGERVLARESGETPPIAAISTLFLKAEDREKLLSRGKNSLQIVDIPRCAAEQYPRLVLGVNDISLFERTLPWDHAAGVLFLNEAGGLCRRHDGSAYRVGDRRTGMLAASSPAMWDRAARILLA